MIEPEAIGWWNTGFPLVLLAGLAITVPRLLAPKSTPSHGAVLVAILGSVVVLLLAGALIFAGIYSARIDGIWSTFTQAPLATLVFFARLSIYAAMLWVPILALVWFGLAQGVAKR